MYKLSPLVSLFKFSGIFSRKQNFLAENISSHMPRLSSFPGFMSKTFSAHDIRRQLLKYAKFNVQEQEVDL